MLLIEPTRCPETVLSEIVAGTDRPSSPRLVAGKACVAETTCSAIAHHPNRQTAQQTG